MVGLPVITHKPPDEKPSRADLDALKARLRARHGLQGADVEAVTEGMTRAAIVATLIEVCRELPAAKPGVR